MVDNQRSFICPQLLLHGAATHVGSHDEEKFGALRNSLRLSEPSLCFTFFSQLLALHYIYSTQPPWLPCTPHYVSHCSSQGHSSPLVAPPASRFTGSLELWTAGPIFEQEAYEGLSTFTPVTLAVKHLWNRSSGSGGWLSQSSFLLMKCFLNPCGPEAQDALAWLDPSLGSADEKRTNTHAKVGHLKPEYAADLRDFLQIEGFQKEHIRMELLPIITVHLKEATKTLTWRSEG